MRTVVDQEAILVKLLGQANGQGVDLITLRAIVEEATELGAYRALSHVAAEYKNLSFWQRIKFTFRKPRITFRSDTPGCYGDYPFKHPHVYAERDCEYCPFMDGCYSKTSTALKLQTNS